MENILSIEIDGEIFRYINNTWVDSMYCEAPGNILNRIYDYLIERADEASYETLLEYAKSNEKFRALCPSLTIN